MSRIHRDKSALLAFRVKPEKGWGVMLINGIVSLLLAIMIYRHWPVSAAWLPGGTGWD